MINYLLDGGLIMVPLLLLSILALAVILDRLHAFRVAEVDNSTLITTITEALQRDNVDDAIQACERFRGPIAAVLLAGLYKYRRLVQLGKSRVEIEEHVNKTMTDYAPHVVQALEKRLNLLLLVASVSPLLGMTGTVTGMIASFDSMAALGGLDGGAVAGGISEALITTAAGLLVAIPAVTFYNLFSKKVDNCILDIEETATGLIDYITLEHGVRTPPAAPQRNQ